MRQLGFYWGIGGILLLLVFAIVRLSGTAAAAFAFEFKWYHWLLLVVNLFLMMYYEGYKGFQLAFSPRAVARARHLQTSGTLIHIILAPVFCMAYYAAPRRRVIATWILTTAIVILILLFQQLPQPIRGILDVGVVIGLSWGVIATVLFSIKSLTDPKWHWDAEIEHGTPVMTETRH